MATAAQKKAAAAAKAKAAEEAAAAAEGDDEDDEVEVEAAPTKSKAEEVTFGASDLAKLLSEGRDKPVTAREIRTLIRKMARDGSGRVNREIIAGNRSRYNWSGPKDPEVKKIIAAFNNGELEADKQEKLAALKARKAEKDAAKKAAKAAEETKGSKSKGKGKKPAAVVEDDDDDLDDDE